MYKGIFTLETKLSVMVL